MGRVSGASGWGEKERICADVRACVCVCVCVYMFMWERWRESESCGQRDWTYFLGSEVGGDADGTVGICDSKSLDNAFVPCFSVVHVIAGVVVKGQERFSINVGCGGPFSIAFVRSTAPGNEEQE